MHDGRLARKQRGGSFEPLAGGAEANRRDAGAWLRLEDWLVLLHKYYKLFSTSTETCAKQVARSRNIGSDETGALARVVAPCGARAWAAARGGGGARDGVKAGPEGRRFVRGPLRPTRRARADLTPMNGPDQGGCNRGSDVYGTAYFP
jgi:hypothetical protein